MTDSLTHLARALVIRSISSGGDEHMNGARLAVLRADALIGSHDDHPATRDAQTAYDRIMAVKAGDMPADPDMIGVLLETLSQRLGGVSRADCWREIGVNPHRGRDLLSRNAHALDWPIFFTLRETALG